MLECPKKILGKFLEHKMFSETLAVTLFFSSVLLVAGFSFLLDKFYFFNHLGKRCLF